jgi:Fic family protein
MIDKIKNPDPEPPGVKAGSFSPGFLEAQPVSPGLVQTIRLLGEYKGKEALYLQQTPQVLEALRESAVIQSTESSNRLEGVTASPGRIRELVAEKVTPRDRSEQEIAGYRDVLATIHVSHDHMPLSTGLVRQLHRDLFQFTVAGGGNWKITDNQITEKRPDGTVVVRFRPVPAWRTAVAMEQLHDRFGERWQDRDIEPLFVLAAYILDFLCIHPFLDGNGRLSRLLTLLLLYRAGFSVGRFISLEQVVEKTREGYYEALQESSRGWHEGTHSLLPWWEYFLGVVLHKAYQDFESRVGAVTSQRGAKGEMVRDAIGRLPPTFRARDIEHALPGVARVTVSRVLAQLKDEGRIRLIGRGAGSAWEKVS